MFTYVMKTKIEELIEEKLNQEFPEEVEIREDPDYDSEEEVTSETEETDDDGWLDHARWPNKTRRAFHSSNP